MVFLPNNTIGEYDSPALNPLGQQITACCVNRGTIDNYLKTDACQAINKENMLIRTTDNEGQ